MDNDLLSKLECVCCGSQSLRLKDGKLSCDGCAKAFALTGDIPDFFTNLNVGKLLWGSDNGPLAYERAVLRCGSLRMRMIDKTILKYAKKDVLEIGCGTCRLAQAVAANGARYFGVDSALSYLQYAGQRHDLRRLIWGRGEKLPFKSGSFDCLISGYYAYRYVNPDLGLQQAHRVLKKGGVFVFSLLNKWFLKFLEFKNIVRRMDFQRLSSCIQLLPRDETFDFVTVGQLKKKAQKAGFFIEKIISTPMFPLPLFSRLSGYLQDYYYRGLMVYLGYDVILVFRAE